MMSRVAGVMECDMTSVGDIEVCGVCFVILVLYICTI